MIDPGALPPVIDGGARILILGSYPGARSLAQARYYAHSTNQFWPLMAAITGAPLAGLPIADRPPALLAHGFALWDVIGSAERPGSLDADIRAPVLNDVPALLAAYPAVRLIAFNGGTAARLARAWAGGAAAETVALPSSSAAYTLAFGAKLAAWREALTKPPTASS